MVTIASTKSAIIIKLSVILISFSLLLSGCADLKSISLLASASSETLKNTTTIDDYPNSLKREKSYELDDSIKNSLDEKIINAQKTSGDALELCKTINLYTIALGRLASDDIIFYKSEIGALQKQIGILKGTNNPYSLEVKSATLLAKAFTDSYRQEQLKEIIKASNEHFNNVISALIKNDENYMERLSIEKTKLALYYRNKIKSPERPLATISEFVENVESQVLDPTDTTAIEGENLLIFNLYMQNLDSLNAKIKYAQKHKEGLLNIKQAQEKIYNNLDNLSSDELRVVLIRYYQDISDINLLLKKQ